MKNNKGTFDSDFKECFRQFVIKYWGERCPDYEETCPCCQAWNNFDTLFDKLESDDDVYEYTARLLEKHDFKTLGELSKEGWNVCAASFNWKTLSDPNTLFYFRRKL